GFGAIPPLVRTANWASGTTGADEFVIVDKNNTSGLVLNGKGGHDVLIGGSGGDTILVADDTFRLVDGRDGSDTLMLSTSGAQMNLNFAHIGTMLNASFSSGVKNIEWLDLGISAGTT